MSGGTKFPSEYCPGGHVKGGMSHTRTMVLEVVEESPAVLVARVALVIVVVLVIIVLEGVEGTTVIV